METRTPTRNAQRAAHDGIILISERRFARVCRRHKEKYQMNFYSLTNGSDNGLELNKRKTGFSFFFSSSFLRFGSYIPWLILLSVFQSAQR